MLWGLLRLMRRSLLGWRCGTPYGQGWSGCGVLSALIPPLQEPLKRRALLQPLAERPPVVYLCIPLPSQWPGELKPGVGGQGSGVQQLQVSRETGKPCVSLAESREVRKRCLLLARLPRQQQVSKPVPSCGDGLFLPAEGMPLLSGGGDRHCPRWWSSVHWWWGQMMAMFLLKKKKKAAYFKAEAYPSSLGG